MAVVEDVSGAREHSVEDIALAREGLAILGDIIAKLPPKCRRVFILRRVHNLSHAEIAKQLEISRHAVEKLMTRGMKRVQEEFERAYIQ